MGKGKTRTELQASAEIVKEAKQKGEASKLFSCNPPWLSSERLETFKARHWRSVAGLSAPHQGLILATLNFSCAITSRTSMSKLENSKSFKRSLKS